MGPSKPTVSKEQRAKNILTGKTHEWQNFHKEGISLHEFLGLTQAEYKRWILYREVPIRLIK